MTADETTEPPAKRTTEPDGVPGTEITALGGNALAFILTALGGLWVWLAVAVAAGVAGIVWWRHPRRRANAAHRQAAGSTSGRRRSTSGSGPLGRSGSGRSGRTGTGGRQTGTGGKRGRRTGADGSSPGRKGRGRGRASASGPDGKGTGKRGRFGLGRRGGQPSGAAKSGSGRKGGSRPGSRLLDRLGIGRGRPGSSGGRTAARTGTGRTGTGRKGAGSRRRPWRAPTGADVKFRPAKPGTAAPAKPSAPSARPTKASTAKPGRPATTPTATTRSPLPHPYRTQNPKHHTMKGLMTVFGRRWRQNAEEMHTQAARYNPEHMTEYLRDLHDMTEAFEIEAKAMGKFTAVTQADLPVDPNLAELLAQTQSLLTTVAQSNREVVARFIKAHEHDLTRVQAPRRGEEKWNVK